MKNYIDLSFSVATWEFDYIEQTNRLFIDGLELIGAPIHEGSIVQICEGGIEAPLRTMLCQIRRITSQLFPGDNTLVFFLDHIDASFAPAAYQ